MVVALSAACQSNPEPAPLEGLDSPSPAASSPSPTTPTPPSMPPAAEGTSRAAAKAFVRHYVSLVNHAMTTGDTGPLERAGAAECESCVGIVERVRTVYDEGGTIESAGWRINSITPVPGRPLTNPMFDVGLELSPQKVVKQQGAAPNSFAGGKMPATFLLARHDGSWTVKEWERSA